MRKIQYCYRFLKKRIKEQPEIDKSTPPPHATTDSSDAQSVPQPTLSPAEVQRLREILQQRDNEISRNEDYFV